MLKVEQKNKIRCPYCHDDIITGQLYGCCCGALYHVDCCSDLHKCASCDTTEGFSGDAAILSQSKSIEFDLDTFRKALKSYPSYNAMTALARANSKGPLFLVGGRVYRTLLSLEAFRVHGELSTEDFDWDFLCYKTTWFRHFPPECIEKFTVTRYRGYENTPYEMVEKRKPAVSRDKACYRFTSKTNSMDLVHAKRVIRSKNQPKDVHGYLQSVPLDIQAVAYDFFEGKLYYTPSFQQAIQRKRVGVNNQTILTNHCKHKGISIQDYMEQKANNVGFDYYYDSSPIISK